MHIRRPACLSCTVKAESTKPFTKLYKTKGGHTQARDILGIYRHASRHTLLKLGQARVHDMALAHLPDLGQYRFPLLRNKFWGMQIIHFRQHLAFHDRSALIVLDVSSPNTSIERNILGESLLAKVAYSIVVGVCKEVHHIWVSFPDVRFEVVHQHPTISLQRPASTEEL